MRTSYRGVEFPSRLDARYAALFDLLRWQWMYEPPFELKGWKPEFLIKGAKPIFVAVRPITAFDSALGDKIVDALDVRESFWGGGGREALICGADLSPENNFGEQGLGWLFDGEWSQSHVFELQDKHHTGLHYGLCHDTNSYEDRISGVHDGDHHMGGGVDLRAMWKLADAAILRGSL
jgi:hypothetical protein